MNKQDKSYSKVLLIKLLTLSPLYACTKTKSNLDINVKKVFIPVLLSSKGMSHAENATGTSFNLPALTTAPIDRFKLESGSTESILLSTTSGNTILEKAISYSNKMLEQSITKYDSRNNTNQEAEIVNNLVEKKIDSPLNLQHLENLDNFEIIEYCDLDNCIYYNSETQRHSKIKLACLTNILRNTNCDGVSLLNKLAEKMGMDTLLNFGKSKSVWSGSDRILYLELLVNGRLDLIKAAAKHTDLEKLTSTLYPGVLHIALMHRDNSIEYFKLIPKYVENNINTPYSHIGNRALTPLEFALEESLSIEIIKYLIEVGAHVTKETIEEYQRSHDKPNPAIGKLLEDTYNAQKQAGLVQTKNQNATDSL